MQVQFTETIKIDYRDARYPSVDQVLHLTIKDANLLLGKLSEVLSEIPH